MRQHDWQGVFPAITTPFLDTLAVDHDALATHVSRLADHGCQGIVALGKRAAAAGCDGLMVLPAYVYRGDWRESRTHFEARPPRLELTGGELADVRALIRERLATRPTFGAPLGQRQRAGVA